jgi:hypothetical protein
MGRLPLPDNLIEYSPGYKKNPSRKKRRAVRPKVTVALGAPPKEWVDGATSNARLAGLLEAWNQIVQQDAVCLKVLNASHRDLVEFTCYLKYRIRRASAGYEKVTSGDRAQLTANLRLMGLTPLDSPRVSGSVRVADPQARGGKEWGELVG